MTRAATASADAVVIRAAAVLGLVWLGDALIYVVLPLHAGTFGIGLGLVGVALSLNRIVRIVGYGWVAFLLATRERSGTTVERLAAFATWVDSGLAVGPLIGGFVVARLGLPLLYDALAVAITVALVVHRLAGGDRVYAIRGIDASGGGS